MRILKSIRLITYSVLFLIAFFVWKRPTAIPVHLSASSANHTSSVSQMLKGEVLSSLIGADSITAQMIWSNEQVFSPDTTSIRAESDAVTIDAATKEMLVRMLSLDHEYDDDGAPCLCYFQPQLRVDWASKNKAAVYSVLISGLSHGEIRAYRNNDQTGMVRDGRFIPIYLELLERVFPEHKTTKRLRAFDNNERRNIQVSQPSEVP